MPPTDRFVSETRFHVRYAETDAMGIVHHASFIVYKRRALTIRVLAVPTTRS
jgi:acyl-CoA thioesterase FadM